MSLAVIPRYIHIFQQHYDNVVAECKSQSGCRLTTRLLNTMSRETPRATGEDAQPISPILIQWLQISPPL